MIERTLYDHQGNVLLHLHRLTTQQAMAVKSEELPDLAPAGQIVTLAGTGRRVLTGENRPTAGTLTVTIGTYGQAHHDAFALQREIVSLAPRIGGYGRVPGGRLDIAGYSRVKRVFRGSAQLGGEVALTLECADPHFWQEEQTQAIAVSTDVYPNVDGVARTGVRLVVTAGAQAVTSPTVTTSAGITQLLGTIPTGGVWVMDSIKGWAATVNGADVSLNITGPIPYLDPGTPRVRVSVPGGTAQLTWREGEL